MGTASAVAWISSSLWRLVVGCCGCSFTIQSSALSAAAAAATASTRRARRRLPPSPRPSPFFIVFRVLSLLAGAV